MSAPRFRRCDFETKGAQLVLPLRIKRARLPKAAVETEPENAVQDGIVKALTAYGYRVLVTSRHRKRERCPGCHMSFWSRNGDGCDKGIGDLLVRNDGHVKEFPGPWPPHLWVMLEVKPDGKAHVRPEQKKLCKAGGMVIVCNSHEALGYLREVEETLKGERG